MILLGYPGQTSDKIRIIPQRSNIGTSQVETALAQMNPNCLVWTKGKLTSQLSLMSVTNSSIGGMTGGALIYHNGHEWVVFGALLGGPAVSGHRELLEVVRMRQVMNPQQDVISRIKAISKMKPGLIFRKFGELKRTYHDYDYWMSLALGIYYSLVKNHCMYASYAGNLGFQDKMNHNLVHRCLEYWKLVV